MDPAEVASAVGQLMAEGKVRAVGVSNMSGPQIEMLQDRLEVPVVGNQLEMSLLKRAWLESTVLVNHAEGTDYSFPHGTVEHCVRHGITAAGVRRRWPAASTPGRRRPRGRRPRRRPPPSWPQLAAEKGTTGEAIVLGWLMRHPAGIAPVIGTANPDRIRACAGAARGRRGDDPRRVVRALGRGPGKQHPLAGPAPPNWLAA